MVDIRSISGHKTLSNISRSLDPYPIPFLGKGKGLGDYDNIKSNNNASSRMKETSFYNFGFLFTTLCPLIWYIWAVYLLFVTYHTQLLIMILNLPYIGSIMYLDFKLYYLPYWLARSTCSFVQDRILFIYLFFTNHSNMSNIYSEIQEFWNNSRHLRGFYNFQGPKRVYIEISFRR